MDHFSEDTCKEFLIIQTVPLENNRKRPPRLRDGLFANRVNAPWLIS